MRLEFLRHGRRERADAVLRQRVGPPVPRKFDDQPFAIAVGVELAADVTPYGTARAEPMEEQIGVLAVPPCSRHSIPASPPPDHAVRTSRVADSGPA